MTEISVEGIGGVHRILYNVVCSVWCAACSVQCAVCSAQCAAHTQCAVPVLQSGGAASAAHLTRPRAYLPSQPPVLQKTSQKRNTQKKTCRRQNMSRCF